jgi:outer membrane protein OmpA-like peptidoglycan-associated protein
MPASTHPRQHFRTTLTYCALVIATLAAATESATAPASPVPPCMAAPSTPDPNSPVTAVLVGITRTDTPAGAGGVRRAAIGKIVDAGFNLKARLLIDTIGGGASDADLAVNTQLVTTGPNDLFRQASETCKKNGVTTAVNDLLSRRLPRPIDVLSALQVLQSHLTRLTNQPIQVVLLSSTLNATPPLVVTPHTLREDPHQLLRGVRRAGLIPNCRNWLVYVIGGGQTTSGGLSDTLNAKLKALWAGFFASCGGQLIVYDQALTQFPVQPPPARSSVTQTHRRNLLVITLPASVLFDSGQSTLRPASQQALDQLLRIVKRYPTGAITVSGYTDSTPYYRPGGNVRLSKRRADAVTNWLAKHGIPQRRLHSVGLGPANPVASNHTDAGRQANRRVEVTIVTPT